MNDGRELDDRLRAALRAEDAELLARLQRDPGMRDVLRAGFRGRMAWWMLLTGVVQLLFFAVVIWTGMRFFGAASVDDRVFWGICCAMAWNAVGMLKLMAWNHVERITILREVKQLELQVATWSLRSQAPGAS